MQIIDHTPYQDQDGKIGFQDRIRGTLAFGLSWYKEMQAQRKALEPMSRILDNKFTLLRNIYFEGLEIPIPLILVGPPGVHALYVTARRGIFRAKDDNWLEYSSEHRFTPAQPNLIARANLMAEVVKTYLVKRGIALGQVEPVLICTDPGMNVDSIHPMARVILCDALEHFSAGLLQESPVLNPENVQSIVALLSHTRQPLEEAPKVENRQPAQARPQTRPSRPAQGNSPNLAANRSASAAISPRRTKATARRNTVTTGQWILLAVLAGGVFCALIAIIIYIVIAS